MQQYLFNVDSYISIQPAIVRFCCEYKLIALRLGGVYVELKLSLLSYSRGSKKRRIKGKFKVFPVLKLEDYD